MPTTEWDAEIIASMPEGTKVRHTSKPYGVGTVTGPPQFGQIPVRFEGRPGDVLCCYPIHLELASEES